MSAQVNDNAHMLIRLRDKGVKLAVVASRSSSLKGRGILPTYEDMYGIPIHRLYGTLQDMFLLPRRGLIKILEIAEDLKPDLIFCSHELNMRLALLIQKFLKKPIVLLVEDGGRIFSGEAYSTSSPTLRTTMAFMTLFGIPPPGPKLWSWLCEKSKVLITCSPRDQKIYNLLSERNKSIFYLPWPCYIPDDFNYNLDKESNRGIYIGSLYPVKNTQEFEHTIPLILEKTKTKQFVVVGPGSHAQIIRKLQHQYGKAIHYISSLPRTDALKLISSSYYAYTPVKTGGWGFIGDCWSMKTPIVMTHNDSYVSNNMNALVAKDENDIVAQINYLFEDRQLYQKLQANGYEEYEKRKADVVGDKLYSILMEACNENDCRLIDICR